MLFKKSDLVPSPAPAGFYAESFFQGVVWHQKWEIFQGVFVPGRNSISDLCTHAKLPANLAGKRVLDVGAWHGCFSFECERRGASEVIAYSLEDPEEVGFYRLKEILGSKVQYIKGSAYTLSPRELGTFDIVLFFGVLYHLRYPLLAIDRLRSVTQGQIFVETHVIDNHPWLRGSDGAPTPIAPKADLQRTPIWRQYREFELGPKDYSNWFGPNTAAVIEGFETAGFQIALVDSWGDRAAFQGKAINVPDRLTRHTYEAFSPNTDFVGLKNISKT